MEGHRQVDEARVGVAAQVRQGAFADLGEQDRLRERERGLESEDAHQGQGDGIDAPGREERGVGRATGKCGVHELAGDEGKGQAEDAGRAEGNECGNELEPIRPQIGRQAVRFAQALASDFPRRQVVVLIARGAPEAGHSNEPSGKSGGASVRISSVRIYCRTRDQMRFRANTLAVSFV